MAYIVFARKYRSQTFDDIVGQEAIAKTLKNAIKTSRVAHAYLFTGTRGVGKTTTARILAKALNCLSCDAPTTEPCCKCESCVAVNAGEDIDVLEIDGATNNGVEQVRELRQNAIYTPARARFKIYIIDEVHMLSVGAFNALLKILEEPPAHVKFIFATTEPNKVIPTIQSRCQRFDFGNISAAKIAGQLEKILKQEKIKYEDDLLLPLAGMANGSMRDALSLLDRLISIGAEPLKAGLLEEFLGKADTEKIANLIAAIGDSDAAAALNAAEDLIVAGMSEPRILDAMIDFMRDLMIAKTAGPESELLILTASQRQKIASLAEKFDIAALVYNITALEKLRWSIKNSENPRPLLEASLLRFALSEHFINLDDLLSRKGSAGSSEIKKKPPYSKPPAVTGADRPALLSDDRQSESIPITNLDSIKTAWPGFLDIVSDRLGSGTRSILNSAAPTSFENQLLTLTFPASDAISRQMCESNGRIEQIESLMAGVFGKTIKLKINQADDPQQPTQTSPARPEPAESPNEILNDPAVKMILTEFSATVTDIRPDRAD